MTIGLDTRRPGELRTAALAAAAQGNGPLPPDGFEFLAGRFADGANVRDRLAAAEALGSFALTAEQLARVAALVEQCGPLEVSWLVRAFERGSAESGRLLIASLARSPALGSLPGERLRAALKNFPADVQSAGEKLLASARLDDGDRAARLAALDAVGGTGDAAKGEELFFGARALCAACHRVGTRGERIGPELSKIGQIRNRRDLVEAIVFPSASLARGYESYNATTKEGRVHAGLIGRETAVAIYLRTSDRVEIRIDRANLDELAPSPTSIMPQGLDKVLTPAEIADLAAYLGSLK